MRFDSFIFLQFFLIVYSLYLLLNNNFKAQNLLLLLASYVFYGYWDWRFLSLLVFSTIIDFIVSQKIFLAENQTKRKLLLSCSIISNLSVLAFFKYFNFFATGLVNILNSLAIPANNLTLEVILPVGISFYTFQTLSYTIDVYRRKLKPAERLLDFAVYVAFFPQLVAGPIERATNFLPQISSCRKIDLAQIDAGIFLILWGYYKKLVIADNIAPIANAIFDNYIDYQGIDIIIGILAFTIQIYCDFSAYSDIARGLAKLMGFELMVNFKLPYFAINPSDFWSRWHISLSSWLRDYLYIPLGGNRRGKFNTYRNLFLTMLLGGLWHGAAWNFVLWGAYQGLILIAYRLFDANRENMNTQDSSHFVPIVLAKMLLMFILTNIGWVIFRSTSPEQIIYLLTKGGITLSENSIDLLKNLVFFSSPLLIVQVCQYITRDLLILSKATSWIRISIYSFFLIFICIYGVRTSSEFFYFQF